MATKARKSNAKSRGAPRVTGPFNTFVEAVLSRANLVGSDGPLSLNLPRARARGRDLERPFEPPPILGVAASAVRLGLTTLSRRDRDALEEAYTSVEDPFFLRRRLCRILLPRVEDANLPVQQREASIIALAALACANDDTGVEQLCDLDMLLLRAEGFDDELLSLAEATRQDEPHANHGYPDDDRDGFARKLEGALDRTRARDPRVTSLGAADAILDLASKTLWVRGVSEPIALDSATGRIEDLRTLMEKRQREPEAGWVAVLATKTKARPSISRAGLWKLKEWLDSLRETERLSERLVSRQQARRVRFNLSALVRGEAAPRVLRKGSGRTGPRDQ